MAGRNVELGTVGFNLEAQDESLLRSLEALRKFGDLVNRAANATDENGRRSYNTMVRIERALAGTFDKVSALANGLNRVGASTEQVNKLTKQYDALANALIKAKGGAESHELSRATVGLGAATSQAARAIKEQESATALLTQRQQSLARATEQVANAASRFKLRGAAEKDLEALNGVLARYQQRINTSVNSLGDLRQAQREYNRELGSTSRAIREALSQQSLAERQQSRLIAATRNVAYLNARAVRSSLPNTYVTDNSAALESFGKALQGGKQDEIVRAQQRLNDALMSTRIAMAGAEKPANRLSIVMHDLSKATVLALGPLSGVGSRIAVMTSLLDSNSVSVALFIGGLVAMGSALASLTTASVRATIEQQKFDALLTTSTGSAALTGQEYQYLFETANRLGISVKALVKPYADFASASRLAGIHGQKQKEIFESLITTGAALRWSDEQLSRAFLAVTQMLSKGTVSTEEMKRQLGELIPNVMGLAAAAEQTSTRGLMKMMSDSELLANEHLPKLSKILNTTFSPGAVQGAATLSGQLNVLGNETFETLKALDSAVGASEGFRLAVLALTAAMRWLKENMSQLIAIVAALTGAAIGGAAIRFAILLAGHVGTLAAGVMTLTKSVGFLRAALIALQTTTVVGWLVTLASAVAGAAVAYGLFKDKADEAAAAGDNINGKVKEWIDQQRELGQTQASVRDQMVSMAGQRLSALSAQIAKEKELLNGLAVVRERTAKAAPYGIEHNKLAKSPNPTYDGNQNAEARKARERIARMEAEQAELVKLTNAMAALKVVSDAAGGPPDDANKAWDSWASRVSSAINKSQGKTSELEALRTGGEDARRLAESVTKAKELLADMPAGGNIRKISDQLSAAGFAGKNLQEQFTALFLAEERATAGIQDFNQKIREQEQAGEKIRDLWEDLANRQKAIRGNVEGIDPEDAKSAKKLADNLDAMRSALEAVGVSTQQADFILKQYVDTWKEVTGAEKHQKDIERVTQALERMGVRVGDAQQKIWAQFDKQKALIQEAVTLRIMSEEEGNQRILEAAIERDRKLYKGANDYYEGLQKIFSSAEDALTDAFMSGGKDAGKAFSDMLNRMVSEIIAFSIRIAIVRPMLENLFGSLYTGQGGSNGIWGNALIKFGSLLFGGWEGGGGATYSEPTVEGPRASGGGTNPFSDYLVGEDGPEILRMGKDGGTVISNAKAFKGNGGSAYTDNSRNIYNIDGRADIAHTMRLIHQNNRRQSAQLQRTLKVRYG